MKIFSRSQFLLFMCGLSAIGFLAISLVARQDLSRYLSASVLFDASGGEQDLGFMPTRDTTWEIELPSNYTKAEAAFYKIGQTSSVAKYIGWTTEFKVNNQYTWTNMGVDLATGELEYYDYSRKSDGSVLGIVKDSAGRSQWLDITQFCKTGTNALKLRMINSWDPSKDAMGIKVRVATDGTRAAPPPKKANGESCNFGTECEGGYCPHGKCDTAAYRCGDGYCDTYWENTGNCSLDCKKYDNESCAAGSECQGGFCVREKCSSKAYRTNDNVCDSDKGESYPDSWIDCAPKKSNGAACAQASECSGNYCINNKCQSNRCGNTTCDSEESCATCASDCGVCKKEIGEACTANAECKTGLCENSKCRALPFCGDKTCDSNETCSACSQDCGACVIQLKDIGDACHQASECKSAYCGDGACVPKPQCGDNYCYQPYEVCRTCPSDCGLCPDGSYCERSQECKGGFCVSAKCQAFKCGNGKCEAGENCSTCDFDCGKCLSDEGGSCDTKADCKNNFFCVHDTCRPSDPYCGDKQCDKKKGEDCLGCTKDCGECTVTLPYCGDEACNGNETCKTCSADCGACKVTPVCGDGTCNGKESCAICPKDCGACKAPGPCGSDSDCYKSYCVRGTCQVNPYVCGDGYCDKDKGENTSICRADCPLPKKEEQTKATTPTETLKPAAPTVSTVSKEKAITTQSPTLPAANASNVVESSLNNNKMTVEYKTGATTSYIEEDDQALEYTFTVNRDAKGNMIEVKEGDAIEAQLKVKNIFYRNVAVLLAVGYPTKTIIKNEDYQVRFEWEGGLSSLEGKFLTNLTGAQYLILPPGAVVTATSKATAAKAGYVRIVGRVYFTPSKLYSKYTADSLRPVPKNYKNAWQTSDFAQLIKISKNECATWPLCW